MRKSCIAVILQPSAAAARAFACQATDVAQTQHNQSRIKRYAGESCTAALRRGAVAMRALRAADIAPQATATAITIVVACPSRPPRDRISLAPCDMRPM